MESNTLGNKGQARKRRWLRWLLEALIIIAIIFAVRTWQQRGMLDGEAPDFEHAALSGETIRLDSYRGKPVLLHFWASWCPMCEMEQGSISAISEDWPVLTIAFQSGGEEEVARYMERKGIAHWVTLVDESGDLSAKYGIRGVPTSYVLDEEGTIRFREVGLTSGWGLRLRLWLADWLV
ncbi:MAG TPA: protein disulfide oxidoreductase [Candidatus Thiothrix moscowensis]|uniref:protein disulfide oxidoreductase n=1 Tax=unclassified Thiothrix TaxID=2636184 RepID=UPI0025E4072B|nr:MULTISPECIES: protein disulfide oxidoreductase [unclassified Thiothrix]HRJ51298.1 protein disulfide oxidoreductase [Candidatus Thiothrix moscowensis]HRJ91647.1 protein disulfide oxidoreductase [Candidatus Thiothrix moscowensis]